MCDEDLTSWVLVLSRPSCLVVEMIAPTGNILPKHIRTDLNLKIVCHCKNKSAGGDSDANVWLKIMKCCYNCIEQLSLKLAPVIILLDTPYINIQIFGARSLIGIHTLYRSR